MHRPVVVLPQPLSPTSPRSLAASDGEIDPVDGFNLAYLAMHDDPFGDRKVHPQPSDFQ